MRHPIHRVRSFKQVGAYALWISFDDGAARTIDFEPILEGEMYGPLRDSARFAEVRLDPEAGTIVWPSGADFDPATLHDWPDHEESFRAAALRWRQDAHALSGKN